MCRMQMTARLVPQAIAAVIQIAVVTATTMKPGLRKLYLTVSISTFIPDYVEQ